ncbi:MAG: pilin [Candidatus Diapherotrites archaeon]
MVLINAIVLLCLVLFTNLVFAETNSDIEKIKEPINKIYDLMKSIISLVGIIAITTAGALYMLSGSNIQQRENAKSMVGYAVIGLVLVWIAPTLVQYLTA